MDALPTTLAGGQQLIVNLGSGGMGYVYLALLRGPAGVKKLQVLKELLPELAQDPDLSAMFLDEGRLATRLSHPNIVQTNAVLQDADRYFIQMEYLEGQSLYAIQRREISAPMPLALYLRILCEVLAGLDYAHRLTDYDGTPLGIVHRDVAPQNVFLTYDGQTKLLDFGIAKSIERSIETCGGGAAKGRLAFMSPEQARGDREVDARSDLFAVGAILFYAVARKQLWAGCSDAQICTRLQTGDIPRLEGAAPQWLAEICARALAVDPAARYASAREMQSDVERGMAAHGLDARGRDVATFVRELFARERVERQREIEAQLRRAESTPPRARSRSDRTPVPVQADRNTPGGSAGSLGESSHASSLEGGEGRRGADSSRTHRIPLAALTAVAVVATFVVAATRRGSHPDLRSADGSGRGAQESAIELRLSATPPSARLYLDDVALPSNPFIGQFPSSSGISHRVRAEASGYVAKGAIVTFARSAVVELALESMADAVAPAATAPAASTPAASAARAAAPRHPNPDAQQPGRAPALPAREPPPFDNSDPWK